MIDAYQAGAVLISGGLDSAILLAELARDAPAVHPLYIRHGLYWETAELESLRRFLGAIEGPSLRPLRVLDLPVADLYGSHWSVTGRDVPDAGSPDEAVQLPGRNLLLLAKAMLWCHLHGIPSVALATLKSNPFPDATDGFFSAYQTLFNTSVPARVEVRRPYGGLDKVAVMRRGAGLPLELTYSCIRPMSGRHCGRCNKCAERRAAFTDAGMEDRTEYDVVRPGGV